MDDITNQIDELNRRAAALAGRRKGLEESLQAVKADAVRCLREATDLIAKQLGEYEDKPKPVRVKGPTIDDVPQIFADSAIVHSFEDCVVDGAALEITDLVQSLLDECGTGVRPFLRHTLYCTKPKLTGRVCVTCRAELMEDAE